MGKWITCLTWGSHLYLKLYILVKKIHVIRVVLQDQAIYAIHRLGVQKRAKLEKGCVLCHIDKFWKGYDRQIEKNACKNVYLGSPCIFKPEKYMFRMWFESPFTRMISSLKYKCPPHPPMFDLCKTVHVLYTNVASFMCLEQEFKGGICCSGHLAVTYASYCIAGFFRS